MAHKTAEKNIAGIDWHLQTLGTIQGSRVLASMTKNARGLFMLIAMAGDEKSVTNKASESAAVAAFAGALSGALADVDTDRLIDDVLTLLGPLQMGRPGSRISASRDVIDATFAGDMIGFATLAWLAIELNYPFVKGARDLVAASLAAVSRPASPVTAN